jgi:small-conductance mechanosensitive channel
MATFETYVLVAVFVLVTLVLAKLGTRIVNRLTQKLVRREKLPSNLAEFAGSLIRGAIWVVAALFIAAEISVTFGLQGFVVDSISLFLSANAGRIGVMLIIVIGGYVVLRIFGIVFSEYRRHTKLAPMTVDLFQSVARYLVYAIIAVMLLTNLLVMAGLQTLAGTLVTLFAVFIGLVVSFAATGSIGNALSGLVVMSWRPYKDGDRVEVGGNVYGDVLEVDVMFTQMGTIKDEVVHVPNSQVLANKIVNYSKLAKVIVHQQITIGYDVSRKLVEKLLLESASRTDNVLTEPKPFVLIRNLDNNYVAYEINAYTSKPNQLVKTYSDLMKNIIDQFDRSGVEILSPQHVAIRKSTVAGSQRAKQRKQTLTEE